MAILVTGGAGFIGSHLIEHLLATTADERVISLDDFNDFYDPQLKRANAALFTGHPRVTLVEQSFCDADAMRGLLVAHEVRQIVHLGAYAGVRASIDQALVFEQNNVQGTLALLEAARGLPLDRFLLVSSSTVYGQGAQPPFVEDAPLGIPLSPYGATKHAAELLGLTYWRLHGVPVVMLRPFSVYGPRVRPDLAMHVFASAIMQGSPLPLLGDGTYRRDFTHVGDVCQGLLGALVAENAIGQAINLGHHEPVAIRDLIALLEDALGAKATIQERPVAAADAPVTCADLGKAQRLLGYQPRVSIEDGVREFAGWFKQNLR